MNKKPVLITVILFLSITFTCLSGNDTVRQPVGIRGFYSYSAHDLKNEINSFLSKAPKINLEGTPFALLVPHAGYVYSGETAAWGFKQIENMAPKTIFIIGSCHNWGFKGASVPENSYYKTPLGMVPVNQEAIKVLKEENSLIKSNVTFPQRESFFGSTNQVSVHSVEHSLEVELPFLQTIFKDFSIVPVLFGTDNLQVCRSVAETLSDYIKKHNDCFIICSTDLTHYPPYEDAKRIDIETLKYVTDMDVSALKSHINNFNMKNTQNLQTLMCGRAAVYCTIETAHLCNADKAELIKYSNSGDAARPYGKKDGVVGYGAVLIYKEK